MPGTSGKSPPSTFLSDWPTTIFSDYPPPSPPTTRHRLAVQPNRGALIRARTLPPAQRRTIPTKDCINAFKLPLPHFDCCRRRDYCRREEEVEAGLVL
ncbi:hypothetical protein L484_019768 [Morus notabilis]|uniref:Uncharacterized protein n=1 Tax=Morus notabilis TaxID=981085 RepID=W9QRJ9_9ROSA|nr:hypothetical protein L484_019768 [Morus notabilis]